MIFFIRRRGMILACVVYFLIGMGQLCRSDGPSISSSGWRASCIATEGFDRESSPPPEQAA